MGSGTVVTGGGVEVVPASSVATLSLEDDEAAPPACPAQNTIFSETNLGRILENGGMATYCVRLTTAPSGGDTTVTIGRDGGNRFAANFSPSTLTFTSSNYQTPQQVTVTGADESGTHRNRPDMRLTHTANGGGYSSQALGNVPGGGGRRARGRGVGYGGMDGEQVPDAPEHHQGLERVQPFSPGLLARTKRALVPPAPVEPPGDRRHGDGDGNIERLHQVRPGADPGWHAAAVADGDL